MVSPITIYINKILKERNQVIFGRAAH